MCPSSPHSRPSRRDAVVKSGGHCLVLIKAQFELTREEVGRGVVRDPSIHHKACDKIHAFIDADPALEWRGLIESSIQGTDGNREFLAWFVRR